MANIKSQVKRIELGKLANAKNSAKKNEVRSAMKKVDVLVNGGKKAEAQDALKVATSLLDQSAQKGVISDNSAARKKAHLQKQVASIK